MSGKQFAAPGSSFFSLVRAWAAGYGWPPKPAPGRQLASKSGAKQKRGQHFMNADRAQGKVLGLAMSTCKLQRFCLLSDERQRGQLHKLVMRVHRRWQIDLFAIGHGHKLFIKLIVRLVVHAQAIIGNEKQHGGEPTKRTE